MKSRSMLSRLAAIAAGMMCAVPFAQAQALDKFPFRLNWTLYGEHAPFFVAQRQGLLPRGRAGRRDPGRQRLDHRHAAGRQRHQPGGLRRRGHDDARRRRNGMPVKAVGVTLQQSPMAFIYRADAARPTKVSEIKGSRIAITAGDASLAIFTAFMGKLGMKLEDVQMITVANPQSKEQAVLEQAGGCAAGLLHGPGPAHAAADRREDGLDAPVRHGRRHHALQRHHREQRLAQGSEERGPPAPVPARLAARLAVHLRQPQRGRRHLHQEGAGVHQGDRAAGDRRHDEHHPHRAHQGQADGRVRSGRLDGFAGRCSRSSPS